MVNMETEAALCVLLSKLFICTVEELQRIVAEFKVEEEPAETTKLGYVSHVKDFVTAQEVTESEDGGLGLINRILAFLTKMRTEEDENTSDDEVNINHLAAIKKQYNENLQKMTEAHEQQLQKLELAFQAAMNVKASTPVINRREFRISGQIGDPGQKDRLGFGSLVHQIEAGLARGHDEREMVDAIIKAVAPKFIKWYRKRVTCQCTCYHRRME